MQPQDDQLAGRFIINGKKCNLAVDKATLSWWPTSKREQDDKQANNRKTTISQIDLCHLIGMRGSALEPNVGVKAEQKGANPKKLQHDKLKVYYVKENQNRSGGRFLKLKKLVIERGDSSSRVNYRNGLISTDVKHSEPIKRHQQQQQLAPDSGPPSCYASQGSSSHLSSLSSRSSSNNCSPIPSPLDSPDSGGDDGGLKLIPNSAFSSRPSYTNSANKLSPPGTGEQQQFVKLGSMLQHHLTNLRKLRPKRVMIFVNPYGGKGNALYLYRTRVKYLLDLADVEATLMVTKYANHARDTLEDPQFNVEHFDGLVCVGGDGMFSELMNGLLFRYNRDALRAKLNQKPVEDSIGKQESIATTRAVKEDDVQTKVETILSDASTKQTNISSSSETHTHNETATTNATSSCTTAAPSDVSKSTSPPEQESAICGKTSADKKDGDDLLKTAGLGKVESKFRSPPIPVGVIGAGSTDANSYGLLGTNDVITATLNIILGHRIKIDACSIHSYESDDLLKFVSTFVAYGYFGDVIRESEKLRWLGPSRYDVTGANTLIKNRTYKGTVRILLSNNDGSPSTPNRCSRNCRSCWFNDDQGTLDIAGVIPNELGFDQVREVKTKKESLVVVERSGSFIGVNAAVTACRCPQTKKGFSPNNHLANGCADLILVRPCSRLQYIQYLLRIGWTKKSAFDLTYVEAFRCRQFEFQACASSLDHESDINPDHMTTNSTTRVKSDKSSKALFSSWNVDGEILNEQSIRVKVNNQLLSVFGTGEPQF